MSRRDSDGGQRAGVLEGGNPVGAETGECQSRPTKEAFLYARGRINEAALAVLIGFVWVDGASAQRPKGNEFQVNSYTTSSQWASDVSTAANGDFVIVWASDGQDGSDDGVFGQIYDAFGHPVGGEFQVNTYTTNSQQYPRVAVQSSGDFVVVWVSRGQDGDGDGIFGQRFGAVGDPRGGEFQVNTYTTDYQSPADVAVDAGGNFVVVWDSTDQDGSGAGVFGQRFDASGDPVGGEFQVNTFTPSLQIDPNVAMTADGDFVVVWQSYGQDGSGSGIFGQRYDASGAPTGGEFQANTFTPLSQLHPAVASDEAGNFVVVWETVDVFFFTSYGVFGQRFDMGGSPAGGEFQISGYTTYGYAHPAVTQSADGDFVVTWESRQEGSNTGVYGREYTPGGSPRGEEFLINTYTTSFQSTASVASNADGDYVVTWSSLDQDGSSIGVFGRRYAKPGLKIAVDGGCPGLVELSVANAPPRSEVGVLVAANNNGFVKGGRLCPGTELEIGEPFALPPTWIVVDDFGSGSATLDLEDNHCWLQALALATCDTSNILRAP